MPASLVRKNPEPALWWFNFTRGCMRRFLPPGRVAAAETKASHEVMELVRKDPALSLLVVRLREAGQPWHQVKAAIEAKIKRARQGRRSRQANTSEPQKCDE
jgi:hypothetical protein